MIRTLLLWDIDGTLLSSGGSGMRALRTALRTVHGIDGSLDDIDWAGRTDRHIARQILTKFGLPVSEEAIMRYLDGYIAELPSELARTTSLVLLGVPTLLDRVAQDGAFAQGLLTGNLRRGAERKLGHHGLWSYFAFGGFADDSEFRNDLGPHAVRRAREHLGVSVAPERVWIIGDTPHDIACGKVIGARTLAVSTGHHTAEQLAAHHPTAVLPNLADTEAVLRLLAS